nr:MAG TPA: hypothetical protein [Caudoviricetes sp.]
MGMFLRRGPAPHRTRLYDKAEGSIIKIAEAGIPVEFYIAKHNYEAGLNGDGRTLIVRKECYDNRIFGNENNAYANSALDSWLCNTYINLLDAGIQAAIGATKFYYTPGNGNKTLTTLQRKIFQLSMTELGSSGLFNEEGSKLPIAEVLKIGTIDGAATKQLTRTPTISNSTTAICVIRADGRSATQNCAGTGGSRPAFTLPSDFLVTNDMLA